MSLLPLEGSGADATSMTDPEAGEEDEVDKDEYYSAIVHVKSFLQFLSSHVVSHTTIASECFPVMLLTSLRIFGRMFLSTDCDKFGRHLRRPLLDHVCLHIRRRRSRGRPHVLHPRRRALICWSRRSLRGCRFPRLTLHVLCRRLASTWWRLTLTYSSLYFESTAPLLPLYCRTVVPFHCISLSRYNRFDTLVFSHNNHDWQTFE